MVGQGSPKTSRISIFAPCVATRLGVRCVFALVVLVSVSGAEADEFRLRLSWGGSERRQWQGEIGVSSGDIAEPVLLGVEPDEPGSMWIDQGRIIVRQRSARDYDAVDFLVRAPRDATLVVNLQAWGDDSAPPRIEASLEQILRDTFTCALDDRGSRLRIERQPGSTLPIHLDSPSMVFSPGDTLSFRMETTNLAVAPSSKIRFVAQLKNPYVEKSVWQSEIKPVWESEQTVTVGETPSIVWEVPLNVVEGIYQLTITATQPGWLPLPQAVDTPLVGGSRSHASRMLELIVVDSNRPNIPVGRLEDLKSLRVVEEIDPTHPEWWKRFASLPRLPRLKGLWNGPLGNKRSTIFTHPKLGPLIQLEPNNGREDLSLEAYGIPIKEPGRPHVLEVSYPSDHYQTFGVSIVEPNESGASQTANLDTGVDQFEEVVLDGEPPQWRVHRVVFWPKTKTPIVLITNLRDGDPALYGRIRVSQVGEHLPRDPRSGGAPPSRLFAAYMDRPLLPESFSAEEVFVPPSRLGLDDWKTFCQGGARLTEYLNHVGYGGLVLSVYADGSTIYPTELLQPTTKYDTGAYLPTGQDPVRKDVLEMLFRFFDREGLKLIPAVEFSTPLPELEAILRQGGPETEGMLWVGRDGRSWTQVHRSYRGRAPYYNVLHPRVQKAMLNVVGELATRYSHHRSFAGIAIQLSADGFAQTPAPSGNEFWGLDDETIRRFEEDTKVKLSANGENRFEERFRQLALSQTEWMDWRAEQVASFYRRMHQQLTSQSPGARLYLAGARMFEGEAMQQRLRPSLVRRSTLAETMVHVGINPRLFADTEGPALLFCESISPWTSLESQSVSLELERMRHAEDLAGEYGAIGAMFYHQPQETTLGSFDQLSPFQPSFTRLTTQAIPSAAQNRRRIVRALAHFDPTTIVDGGLRMSLGQEESLRDLIALYRRLPSTQFQTAKPGVVSEPLVVRSVQHADMTYLLIVNEAGFPVTGRIRLQTPAGCRLEELTGFRPVSPLRADQEGCYWDVQLDAYDAVGAWMPSGSVQVTSASARWSSQVAAALDKRVSELVSRRFAAQPRQWEGLENTGFEIESPEPDQIPGWSSRRDADNYAEIDASQAHSGQSSLKLVSANKEAFVVSPPFRVQRTGRLGIKLWARSGGSGSNPPLRVGVYSVQTGRTFVQEYRPAGQQWSEVPVNVPDVPVDGVTQLRLFVQLAGPGEVWIDDVQIGDLAFQRQEEKALLKAVVPAREFLAGGQISQCIRILESYWPRFLLQHVPPLADPQPAVASAPEPPAPAEQDPEDSEEESRGVLGRIRNLVPKPLRF